MPKNRSQSIVLPLIQGKKLLAIRGRIHVGAIGYTPTLPSRIRPLNTEPWAVGVMRQVADTRLAVKSCVAYPADTNTAPGAVFSTTG